MVQSSRMTDAGSPKINPWMVSTLVLVGIGIGFGLSQIPALKILGKEGSAAVVKSEKKAKKIKPATGKTLLSAEQIVKLPDDDPVIGQSDAPITVVEFSDFQCPFCARFVNQSFAQIEENYIKTGKVKLVYRDFPLSSHPQAPDAALAGECADEQDKFREMHDMIFENQDEWANNDKAQGIFKEYAVKLGLDTKQYGGCVDEKKYGVEITKDIIDGTSVGVSGTPAFFINGKLVSGAMPYEEVFKPIFEAELAGKKWELQYDSSGRPSIAVE